jgi:hypothetical protein
MKDKYGTMSLKTIAVNPGTFDQNSYVDVAVTIPGTPILAVAPGQGLHLVDREAPAYDLAGRRIADPASLQAAFLPSKNGRMRLALQR